MSSARTCAVVIFTSAAEILVRRGAANSRSGGQSLDKVCVVILVVGSTHAGATPRKHGEWTSFSEVGCLNRSWKDRIVAGSTLRAHQQLAARRKLLVCKGWWICDVAALSGAFALTLPPN